jgi:hypothetical protein
MTCDSSMVFSGTPVFSTNKTDSRYNWNMVESGIKHHKPRTIFHLYCESVLLVEETGVPGENHRPDFNSDKPDWRVTLKNGFPYCVIWDAWMSHVVVQSCANLN